MIGNYSRNARFFISFYANFLGEEPQKIINKDNKFVLLKDISALYRTSKSRYEFKMNLKTVSDKWKEREPGAIRILKRRIDSTLTYFNLDEKDRVHVTTNSKIERFIKEIRRRMKNIDGFENDSSLERFFYLLCIKLEVIVPEDNYEK